MQPRGMPLTRAASAVLIALLPACLGASRADSLDNRPVVVAVPARAGAVNGTPVNSDEFI